MSPLGLRCGSNIRVDRRSAYHLTYHLKLKGEVFCLVNKLNMKEVEVSTLTVSKSSFVLGWKVSVLAWWGKALSQEGNKWHFICSKYQTATSNCISNKIE